MPLDETPQVLDTDHVAAHQSLHIQHNVWEGVTPASLKSEVKAVLIDEALGDGVVTQLDVEGFDFTAYALTWVELFAVGTLTATGSFLLQRVTDGWVTTSTYKYGAKAGNTTSAYSSAAAASVPVLPAGTDTQWIAKIDVLPHHFAFDSRGSTQFPSVGGGHLPYDAAKPLTGLRFSVSTGVITAASYLRAWGVPIVS